MNHCFARRHKRNFGISKFQPDFNEGKAPLSAMGIETRDDDRPPARHRPLVEGRLRNNRHTGITIQLRSGRAER